MSTPTKTPNINKVLRDFVKTEDNRAWYAAYLLGFSDDKKTVTTLIDSICYHTSQDGYDCALNCAIAFSLGMLKDERAFEPLIELLNEEIYDIRATAAWALGELENKNAIPFLEKAMENDEYGIAWLSSSRPSEGLEGEEYFLGCFLDFLSSEIIMADKHSAFVTALHKLGVTNVKLTNKNSP